MRPGQIPSRTVSTSQHPSASPSESQHRLEARLLSRSLLFRQAASGHALPCPKRLACRTLSFSSRVGMTGTWRCMAFSMDAHVPTRRGLSKVFFPQNGTSGILPCILHTGKTLRRGLFSAAFTTCACGELPFSYRKPPYGVCRRDYHFKARIIGGSRGGRPYILC